MSTSATSGSACSTRSSAGRDVAGRAHDLEPPCREQRLEPSRSASWSSTMTSLVTYGNLPTTKRSSPQRAGKSAPTRTRAPRPGSIVVAPMAKDTEKLIRQLSLISYLMAERRPVTALEIRRDVEGYSGMNEDAFARRFYADRAELESLGIQLTVDKPADGVAEQENYSLRPENFHLPAIEFTDAELAALQTALSLLDGEFAYAEPLRLALQQISWGRPSPLRAPEQGSVALGITALGRRPRPLAAPGEDRDGDLPPQDDHVRLLHDGARRGRRPQGRPVPPALPGRPVLPAGPLARARRAARLPPVAHPRQGRLRDEGRARLQAPGRLRPAPVRHRADWQFGDAAGHRRGLDLRAHRLAGRAPLRPLRRRSRPARTAASDVVFVTEYADVRQLVAWVLRLGEHARVLGPPELADEVAERAALLARAPRRARSSWPSAVAPRRGAEAPVDAEPAASARRETAIRPERFARLVTLASILIEAGRAEERARSPPSVLRAPADLRGRSCARTSTSSTSSTSAAAPTSSTPRSHDDGEIEVDPEPYSDNFARPARLLPVEAKALVAAIDLIGDHLPEGSLSSAREKIVAALGADPMEQGLQVAARRRRRLGDRRASSRGAIAAPPAAAARVLQGQRGRVLRAHRRAVRADQRARGLVRRLLRPGAEATSATSAWTASSTARCSTRRFTPRPEVDPAADVEGWPRTGEVEASRGRARVDLARARPLGARGAPRGAGARRRLGRSSSCPSRAPTGSCARCSRRPATPPCSSPPTPARPSARPCSRLAPVR